MKYKVFDLDNKEIEEIELNDSIFSQKVFPDLINNYIKFQMSKHRSGNHKVKSRSEVRGKSKKPFAQKGTGNARQGSSKPPHFRGGAVVMGPVNRDHSFDLNKKEKKLALKSALSTKLSEEKIIFVESLKIENHKTKDLYKNLNKFNYDSALFIYSDDGIDKNFRLASSNLPKVSVLSNKGINVKDLLLFDKVFIEKKSLDEITKRLS